MTTNNELASLPKNQEIIEKVGRRISVLREIRAITQNQLAKHSNISVKDLRQYEKGSKVMNIDELITIAAALDMGAFHFFI